MSDNTTDDPPEKEYIDILGDELKYGWPHWLHPTQKHADRQRENQIKHRDRWLAEQKAKRKKTVKKSDEEPELETEDSELTEEELWPGPKEDYDGFMDRCITGLIPCIGADRAVEVCDSKWNESELYGKKGVIDYAKLSGDLAVQPCGKACITCEGADAPFVRKTTGPLYVRRDLQNVEAFTAWARAQGFDEVNDDLHVTVLYSKTPVDWDDMGDRDTGTLVVPAGGKRAIKELGDEGAIVLLFESAALEQRHDEMVSDGASHDYDEYRPHVTINLSGAIPADAEPYTGELVFGPEIFESIIETKAGYDPSEPRDEGGKWTSGGGSDDELGSMALGGEDRNITASTRKVDALRDEMGIDEDKIPVGQRQALDMYTQDSTGFNGRARGGGSVASAEIENLDALVNGHTLPNDITVYRTVGWQRTQAILEHAGSFSDRGYMSTTLDKSKIDKPGSYIEIQVPKGSKAFPVGSLSNYPEEAEILFPRDARLQIISHEPRDAPNTERFVARLVS